MGSGGITLTAVGSNNISTFFIYFTLPFITVTLTDQKLAVMMLAQRLGFCFGCHSTFYMDHNDLDEYGEPKKKPIKPMMYTDIATDHEYSSANTAHKKCEKALMKLKEAIKDLI